MGRILTRLGEDASLVPSGGAAVTVRGIFLNGYKAAELGVIGVTGSEPHFAALTADLGSVAPGDALVRNGTTFKVKVVRPDDPSGLTVLELKRT